MPAHAAEEFVVEHQLLVHVERPRALPGRARPEDRRLRQPMAEPDRQHPLVIDEGRGVLDAEKAVVLVDEAAAPHHHMAPRRRVDLVCHAHECPRLERIVRVEEGQDVAARAREALVDGIGLAAVGLANDDEVPETGEDRGRVVARESVDDDMLEIGIILVEHAPDGALDESPLIERGGHDRDPRPAAGASLPHLGFGRTCRARALRCGHHRHVEGCNSSQGASADLTRPQPPVCRPTPDTRRAGAPSPHRADDRRVPASWFRRASRAAARPSPDCPRSRGCRRDA